MKKIIFATSNEGKLKEIRAVMEGVCEVISLADAGINTEIDETGTTFEENALIKVRTIVKETDMPVMADDSGLEIDCLNKEPGVYSARYMGHETPYPEKNKAILKKLEGIPDDKRTARFVCAIACAFPDGREFTVRDTIEGIIGHEIKGENGFGYDPIFYIPELGKTTAELSPDEKNKISHRGKALRAALKKFKEEML